MEENDSEDDCNIVTGFLGQNKQNNQENVLRENVERNNLCYREKGGRFEHLNYG